MFSLSHMSSCPRTGHRNPLLLIIFTLPTRNIVTLFLTLTSAGYMAADLQNFVDMVIAVQDHYMSGCIYLLHDHEEFLNSTMVTVKMSKLMFQKYIQTTLGSRNGSMQCKKNRPLYVVPDRDEGYQRSLKRDSSQSAVWLKFLETQNVTEFFKDKDVPFNCDFLVAEPTDEDNLQYMLSEVYRVEPTLPLKKQPFGAWDPPAGLTYPAIGFYERRKTLQGVVLKTAVQKGSSLLLLHDIEEQETEKDFFYEVWLVLQNVMNFKPEYRAPEMNVNGVKLDNGSWNGILGLIQRREAEISCEDLSMSPTRAEVVDFMVPIKKDRHYVYMRRTDHFELSWGSFLLPYSTEIWFAMAITITVLATMLWIIYKFSLNYWKESINEFVISFGFHDSIFYIFGSFCQQGLDKMPNSLSGRVVCLVSYLTAVVLLAGYSASLISYLTLRKPVLPFTTFEGLLKDSTYKFGVSPYSSVYSFFKEGKEPVIYELYERFLLPHENTLPETTLEGLQRICYDHRYTFLSSTGTLEQNGDQIPCRLQSVPKAFLPGSRAMVVARNSPYLGIFSHYLLKLRSVGILRRLEISTSTKEPEDEQQFLTMDLVSVAPIFTILAAGTVISILLLLVELVLHYSHKQFKSDKLPNRRKYRKDAFNSVHFIYKRRAHRHTLKINLRL